MKTLLSLSKLMLIACTAVLFPSCNKHDSGLDYPGGGGNISLTEPAPHTGTVPKNPDADPEPQVSDVYAPFVGVWRERYQGIIFVFLNDGRVAAKQDGKLSNIGFYSPSNTPDWFYFKWALLDEERNYLKTDGNGLSLNEKDFERVGDASDAQEAYNEIYNVVRNYAKDNAAKFPTGAITNAEANSHDPHPNNVIPGATVFTTGAHFQESFISTENWYDMPDGTVEGFDGYSRTDVWLMPNGRFFMQLWLWDGVDPRNRMESYTHQYSWGKYTIIKGNDLIKGDIINFYYDTGESAAYRTKVGQSCFLTKEVFYHNK